jgi:tRNA (uracil-5-)-methyltransferase TRM9
MVFTQTIIMGMMKKTVIKKILDINDQFYREFGESFAATRRRVQPGVLRVLDEWVKDGKWLDLGCGSGALGGVWVERGIGGLYEGLDFSPVQIAEANATTGKLPLKPGQMIQYRQANFGEKEWVNQCSQTHYEGVLMFAALHHLPGGETRFRLMEQVACLLLPGALFIHSEWQFQRSPKLLARVQDWQTAGLDPEALERGDTLLDWRQSAPSQIGKRGLRYVHLFEPGELQDLAEKTGFTIISEFNSDGKGENLSLYQIWQRKLPIPLCGSS